MTALFCSHCQSYFEAPDARPGDRCPRCGGFAEGAAITTAKPPSVGGFPSFPDPASLPPSDDRAANRKLRRLFPEGLPEQAQGLGDPLTAYTASRAQRWMQALLGSFVLLVSLVFFIGAGALLFQTDQGTLPERLLKSAACLLTAVGCSVWGVFLLRNAYRQSGTRLVVFDDGLLQMEGKSIQALRWDELETVRESRGGFRMGVSDVVTHELQLVRTRHIQATDRHGRTILATDALGNFRKLAGTIHTKIAEHKVPPAREQLNAGQTLQFGPARINAQGLSVGEQHVPWADLKTVDVQTDNVAILTKREIFDPPGSGNFAFHEVPNVNVLWVLAEECKERADG